MSEDLSEKPIATIKEFTVYFIITVLAWIWSFSIIFPFFLSLCLSSWLRNKFFSWIYSTFVKGSFPKLDNMRERLFDALRSEYISKNPDKKIRYLEMGVGPGANFKYYSGNYSLTLLDKNPDFEFYFENERQKYPDLHVDKIIFGFAEDMKEIEDNEYDVVVETHFLCSVTDLDSVLKEVSRVLKPGGKFIAFDHVGFPKYHPAFWLQRIISPLWRIYCNGCHLDRHLLPYLLKANFSKVKYDILYAAFMPLILRPQAIIIATK